LKDNEYVKLSGDELYTAKSEFNSKRKGLIEEWEKNTGKEWPSNTKDVMNKEGTAVLRKAGQPYDAHHIIEQSTNGPNEWWNLHPARYPDEHQGGIHAADKLANQIF
jgi:predicted ribonuclease toxin of YeeF-YezG toxin-antitoxin module